VRDRLRGHPLVVAIDPGTGPDHAVARLASGVRCDLYTARPEQLGVALIAATGPDAHVAALLARGLDLATAVPDEAAVYRAAGLPAIPPEVRDGDDALSGDDFADLIRAEDIRGAVHCHTVHSDGKNTIAEMATAAASRGLDFITITDHSVSAGYAGGLTEDRLRAQWEEIAAVQRQTGIRLLRGTESDIRRDGELDYDDAVLGELDVVIASIHQRYKLDPEAMTRRVVTAMRHPVFKIWGHALGRMVLSRPPIDVDFDAILDAIAESPAAIEINGDPHRLDLDPERARRAQRRGVKFVLSTDAHSVKQLDYLENAVAMARRARIRKRDVLNALPPDEFARHVKPARPGRARS
jgi:DNA polymerase (family 10)